MSSFVLAAVRLTSNWKRLQLAKQAEKRTSVRQLPAQCGSPAETQPQPDIPDFDDPGAIFDGPGPGE